MKRRGFLKRLLGAVGLAAVPLSAEKQYLAGSIDDNVYWYSFGGTAVYAGNFAYLWVSRNGVEELVRIEYIPPASPDGSRI